MSTHCSNHNEKHIANSAWIHKYMKSDNSFDKREEKFVGWYHEIWAWKRGEWLTLFKHKCIGYLESDQLISNFKDWVKMKATYNYFFIAFHFFHFSSLPETNISNKIYDTTPVWLINGVSESLKWKKKSLQILILFCFAENFFWRPASVRGQHTYASIDIDGWLFSCPNFSLG